MDKAYDKAYDTDFLNLMEEYHEVTREIHSLRRDQQKLLQEMLTDHGPGPHKLPTGRVVSVRSIVRGKETVLFLYNERG